MNAIPSRFLAALTLSFVVSLMLGSWAHADTLAAKEAQATRVARQISALDTKAEIAAERYNAARVRYDGLLHKVRVTERKIKKIRKHMRYLQSHLNTRASDMYRGSSLGFLAVVLSARSYEDFDASIRVLTSLNEQDASTVSQLKATKATVQKEKTRLLAAKNAAGKQKLAMAANARAVKAKLAARKHLLAGLTAEIQVLIARRLADRSAPEQARFMAKLLQHRSPSSGGIYFGGETPPGSKAAGAVYWAEKQLGKRYVWGAAGPNTFDCSGLVMYAYAHVGVKMNHYSGDQIHEGRRVSRSNLRPGDLVFFGSPIHHVGMYVGGGNFIEAPYTGANVKITRLSSRGDYAGACRPS